MTETPKPARPSPPPPETDAGHVPMTEEFDSAKWTLPPVIPIVVALVIVAVVVAFVVFANRATDPANGAITKVIVAPQEGNVLVAVHMKINSTSEKPLYIRRITSELQTSDGKSYTDSAAPAVDVDRYLQAFPQLAEGKVDALKEELKIPSRASQNGMTVFSYPVDKPAFDGRKSLIVRVHFYDQAMVLVLKQ